MNVKDMSLEELESIKITSTEQGKLLAEEIRLVQIDTHRQMVGLYDKKAWRELCSRHYELRRIRRKILHDVGHMVAMQKHLYRR